VMSLKFAFFFLRRFFAGVGMTPRANTDLTSDPDSGGAPGSGSLLFKPKDARPIVSV